MARKFFSLPLLLLLTLTLSSALPPPSPTAAAAAAAGNRTSTEFIRSSCGSTLYPDLCFASLSRYATAVQKNPVQLAQFAAKVTFARLRSTSAHASALLRARGPSGREAAALRDCVDSLGSAGELTRRSAEEIGRLEAAVGPEVAWRVSNAQTWMSAAITNEETCRDGFDGVVGPDRTVAADVCGRVGRVKEYTSNALALANSLVNGP